MAKAIYIFLTGRDQFALVASVALLVAVGLAMLNQASLAYCSEGVKLELDLKLL